MSDLVHGFSNIKRGLEDMGKSVRDISASIVVETDDAKWEERPCVVPSPSREKRMSKSSMLPGGGERRTSMFGGAKRESINNDTWVERHNVKKRLGYEVELYDVSAESIL